MHEIIDNPDGEQLEGGGECAHAVRHLRRTDALTAIDKARDRRQRYSIYELLDNEPETHAEAKPDEPEAHSKENPDQPEAHPEENPENSTAESNGGVGPIPPPPSPQLITDTQKATRTTGTPSTNYWPKRAATAWPPPPLRMRVARPRQRPSAKRRKSVQLLLRSRCAARRVWWPAPVRPLQAPMTPSLAAYSLLGSVVVFRTLVRSTLLLLLASRPPHPPPRPVTTTRTPPLLLLAPTRSAATASWIVRPVDALLSPQRPSTLTKSR